MKKHKKPQIKTLDLHGYKSDDVFDVVDRFLLEASRKSYAQVRIMTGKGKGIVKDLVIDYLKKAGYPWKYERSDSGTQNTGVLIVFVD